MNATISRQNFSNMGSDICKANSIEEALQIAKADFQYQIQPIYFNAPGLGMIQVPDSRGVFRADKNGNIEHFLTTIGNRLEPLQPVVQLECCKTLAGEGARYDRLQVVEGGMQIWVRMVTAEKKIGGEVGDIVSAGAFVRSGVDGTCREMADFMERLACKNGLTKLVKGNFLRLKNTKNATDKMQKFCKNIIARAEKQLDELDKLARQTARIQVSEQRFQGIVEELIPITEDVTKRVRENLQERRAGLVRAFRAEDLANFRNTGWAVLQAVSDYSDHFQLQDRNQTETNLVERLVQNHENNEMLLQARELVLALA